MPELTYTEAVLEAFREEMRRDPTVFHLCGGLGPLASLIPEFGEERVFAMQGSMTMAQDPVIDFDYRTNGSETLSISARDSGGGAWQRTFPIGQGS